jgi:predicted transcriptional regulator
MKHRTRTDIIGSMLEAAMHGAPKTKVMYSSYLSSNQLKTYLEIVISNGLLEYDSTKERYKTTQRGLRVLALYASLCNLVVLPTTHKY